MGAVGVGAAMMGRPPTADDADAVPDAEPTRPPSSPRWGSWAIRQLSPVGCVVLVLIGLGVFLRVHAFAFPQTFLFDEHHFVENARNYLRHQPDWNDHPPLGKLFIAASMLWWGDNPVGWRAPALLGGLLVLAAGALAAARLFRSRRAGALTAALLSADGFLISYSRAGLLDGYLAACAILSLLVATLPWTPWTALAAGLLGGIACSIKFSGAAVLVPLLIALATVTLSGRRKALLAAILLATVLVTYVGSFSIGLGLARHPASVLDVIRETLRLVAHHAALTDMKNAWASSWPTWLLPARPLLLGYISQTGSLRVLSSLGNLATWWAAMILALTLGWTILVRGLETTWGGPRWGAPTPHAAAPSNAAAADEPLPVASRRAPRGAPSGMSFPELAGDFLDEHGRATLLVLSTALAFLAPWILTRRDSYIYHFLPSYAVLVLLLGGFLDWWQTRRPSQVLHFLLVVLLVAAFYAPVWSFLPLDPRGVSYRLFLGSWR
jgi:dolichyl-phosphate-mannose--protein O-mannosyl transferase